MSVLVMNEAWEHSKQGGNALIVLLKLADNADDERRLAWPSVPHLAKKCRMSERTVQRALRELEAAGEISTHREGGRQRDGSYKATVYRVHPQGRQCVTPPASAVTKEAPAGVTPVSPSTVKEEPSTASPNGEASRLAELLADRIEERWRRNGIQKPRPKVTQTWVTDVDRLLRIDRATAHQVEAVIEWCNRDGNFWAGNIESPKKLREKFTRLVADMAKERGPKGRAGMAEREERHRRRLERAGVGGGE